MRYYFSRAANQLPAVVVVAFLALGCAMATAQGQMQDEIMPLHETQEDSTGATLREEVTGSEGTIRRLTVAAQRFAEDSGVHLSGDSRHSSDNSWPGATYYQPLVWYNRVDAFHLGLERRVVSNLYEIGTGGGWRSGATGRDRWDWHVYGKLNSQGKTSLFVEGRYQVGTARRYGENSAVSPLQNSAVMLLGGEDYFDYYRREGFVGTTGVVLEAAKTRVSGTFRHEMHTPLSHVTSYDFFGQPAQRSNPTINDGLMQSMSASIEVGLVRPSGQLRQRGLVLNAEGSTSASSYSFRLFEADVRWYQPTYSRHSNYPATLNLRFIAGTSTGSLPIQRAFIVDTRQYVWSALGSLRSVSGRPYEGDAMVALFWEHNFRSVPFKVLRLNQIRRVDVVAFGGHARAWTERSSMQADDLSMSGRKTMEGTYHELGVSLRVRGQARIGIDFAKPLDGGRTRVGINFGRSF